MESFSDVFNLVKDMFKENYSSVAYNLWIDPLEFLKIEGNTVHIFAISDFHKKIIHKQYVDTMKEYILSIMGYEVEIVLHETRDADNNDEEISNILDDFEAQKEVEVPSINSSNYDHTFETFIVGGSNNFAYAACKAVSQKNNSNVYNPLFIHGPSGLGKTHLLFAIKHEFQKNHPNSNILYISSETFTNEIVDAIMRQSTAQFHNKYRNVDLFLMDDIQFIAGKERAQEEFFHTFNALHQVGKQIVLTSDRPPKDIKTLEERLKNRFEWGLLTDISMPEFETRIAIIRRKAELLNINVPDDVAQFIANKLKSNIRQLEGAVKKIKAYKYLAGSSPTISVAQTVINEILNDDQPTPLTVEKIIEEVAKTYSVTADDIRSSNRAASVSTARQIAIYVVREITQMSQASIGEEFGGRDHATVLYAIQKVKDLINKDSRTKEIIEDIIKNIRDN